MKIVMRPSSESGSSYFSYKSAGESKQAGFIGYLSNNIFPPLLTEAEEAQNLRLLADGDMSARNVLIEHNLRLVAHICKKFETTGIEKGDLLSIGTVGLIKGINTYNLEKGTRLATYVARCIENAMLTWWLFGLTPSLILSFVSYFYVVAKRRQMERVSLHYARSVYLQNPSTMRDARAESPWPILFVEGVIGGAEGLFYKRGELEPPFSKKPPARRRQSTTKQ